MLNKFIYGFVYLLSLLPLFLLRLLAWKLYFIVYYIVGYRKNVVFKNLRNSFPEKTEKEITHTAKDFYYNFTCYIVETIKLFSISKNKLREKVSINNLHLAQENLDNKKNTLMLSGHVFNWEWTAGASASLPQKNLYGAYQKLKNPFWDKKIQNSRQLYGNILVDTKKIAAVISTAPKDGNSVFLFLCDQSPSKGRITYFLQFLNQETPVITGYEDLIIKNDMAVLYNDTERSENGKNYIYTLIAIKPDNGHQFEPGEVVRKYHVLLEKTIRKNPANYMWTHRKWKHKKENQA